jgi:iron complex transport system substrate-binding protein
MPFGPSAGVRRTSARAAIVLLTAAVLIAAGCSRSRRDPTAEAMRVVSLGPATTEALFAIGAGDRVVGRSKYCDFPPEALRVPSVGGQEPDVEAILELRPDLVVGPSGQWSTHLSERLAAHGIATWFPDEIGSLAGVDAMLVELGVRTGHAADARRVTEALDAKEAAIAAAVAGKAAPRVLLVVGLEPKVVAAGPGGFADELLRRAGAVNAVEQGGAWPALGFERVLEIDPDVIVDVSVAETGGATRITRDAHPWSALRAVRQGRVVAIDDERVLRPGPRVAEGVAVLARALHPDAPL